MLLVFGQVLCTYVVRIACGGRIKGGPFHSCSPETFYAHTPGWYICYPSTAEDAKGLIKTAARCDDTMNHSMTAKATETWRFPPFFHALLAAGVYPPCSAFEAWFVSTALDDDAFGRIAAALPAAARAAAGAEAPA